MRKPNADSGAGYDIAPLRGSRLVAVSETGEGDFFDEGTIKQITGSDPVTCRLMRENFWTYTPEFKVFFATNHRPNIKGDDHGIWRRIRLIPFDVTIPDGQQDKQLLSKLEAEMLGILA
jgi:putative DNA primase/helicase